MSTNKDQVRGRIKEAKGKINEVAGILGLPYRGFTYTKETHQAKIGPFEMSVNEKQTINTPVWAAIGAIVLGGGLLLVGGINS